MKCDICDAPGAQFTRVNHTKYGIILLCDACLAQEKTHLLSLSGAWWVRVPVTGNPIYGIR